MAAKVQKLHIESRFSHFAHQQVSSLNAALCCGVVWYRHGGRFAKRPYFFHLRHISGTSSTGEVMSRSKSQSAGQRGMTPNMLPPKVTMTI